MHASIAFHTSKLWFWGASWSKKNWVRSHL